ncbi:putative 1-phosphatidylinositol-3-phosphate 5-kinase FAB1D [Silene latifolia]|uniref:putative 1-phosphatidylinositol-3-phosphate 5-kinase FAB1D n=1 Tax=Silene latifolia TaxID=37657 RepID=UPI003D76AE21
MCQSYLESNERMEPTENERLAQSNDSHVGSSTLDHMNSEQGRNAQQNVSSSQDAPSTNPTIHLTSSDSCVSNYSDYSVEFTPQEGLLEKGDIQSSQYDPNYKPTNENVNNSGLSTSENDLKDNQHKGNNGFVHENLDNDDINNDESEGAILDEVEENPITYDDQHDIWLPPEAENEHDNMENSMAALDEEDDECAIGDASEWAMPSSLSSSEEALTGYRLNEDRQRAIEDVMNGKFKNLVSQLLKKVGVEDPDNKEENWVNTVTLLAWQAASFVKPEAADGKAMDPAGYVKIKCIATGSLGDSQVIKGLVFKKHAAHKHMSTKYKNPRLLLVQGALEPSNSSGLSSFSSLMVEDKDNLVDLVENLQACHPNVILVEKSASRDVLQKVLDLEVTLVLDMKLHRLERVARCTGSPILSSDKPFSTKLKQCESLYFEKFVEEHAIVAEGGKKPCKTLMFLEGCPTRLGCTILLKGSHNEELKKIKCVVQCAVVMAYHFLLETSFLADQEAMFSTIACHNVADSFPAGENISISSEMSTIPHSVELNEEVPISNSSDVRPSPAEESTVKIPNGENLGEISPVKQNSTEVVTSNGGHDKDCNNTQHMTALSRTSSSINFMLEKVSVVSPATFEDMSTYIDMNKTGSRFQNAVSIPISPSDEAPEEHVIEVKNVDKDEVNYGEPQLMSSLSVTVGETKDAVDDSEDCIRPKEDISNLLDSESILVLMSSRNAAKGTICGQSHFSHIKFYRHFDVPLGKFLRDDLFNQTVCKTCNELPEAHFYYYAHHSKQLSIKVKRFGDKMCLPGGSEGKLWMWSRCGKCAPSKEKATKRVLISKAARGLSFGKFLELSFSSHSSFNRLSSCGHSFQKDFLYFFGLGSMVAMFRYSRVVTYNVSVPPQKLDFNCSINGDWIQKEIETVSTKGQLLFTEVANYLKKLESRFSGQHIAVNGSSNGFPDIVDMLRLERSEFEENIKNTGIKNEASQNTVHKLLSLNRLRWEILLEACVWERRLQLLVSSLSAMPQSTPINDVAKPQIGMSDSSTVGEEAGVSKTAVLEVLQGQPLLEEHLPGADVEGTQKFADKAVQEKVDTPIIHIEVQTMLKEDVSHSDHKSTDSTDREIHIEDVEGSEASIEKCPNEGSSCENNGFIEENPESQPSRDLVTSHISPNDESTQDSDTLPSDNLREDRIIPIEGDQEDAAKEGLNRVISPPLSKPDSRVWVWNPFSEIREECMMDLHRGHMPKFGHLPKFVLLRSSDFLPMVSEMTLEEGSRLHIPLRDKDYIVSDFEGEISSLVACALAAMKDVTPQASENNENATLKRAFSEPSPNWTTGVYLDPDLFHTASSMSFADHIPNFEGLNHLDSSVSYGQINPEVTLGVEKYPTKGKCSVVIIHAKDFRAFREQCCPSELDYIASLSRCKFWDAKGGKSKSLFLKTLDDRLIIKEIKKTEFESFMKFAPGYFRHMKDSVQSGNQTCLAKILGIYQVSIRNPKSGRETKHDLMVMENLSFGRNITRQYDLKGALHARFTADDGTGDVLLDQNFVNDMNASPLYVGQRAKRLLQRAVWNDTTFLHNINVMDYSLLVGVDRKQRELLCGIIDYLRQYTWDKQLETWVKSSLVMPKNVAPTIVSPETYKKRFRKFMDTHFLTVPDHWCSHRSSNPCKLCGVQRADSLQRMEKREELNGFHAHD